MSCYTRHLRAPMAAAGLPFDRSGKRETDRRVRAGLGLPEADCPEVWRQVKRLRPGEVQALLRAAGAADTASPGAL